MAEKGHEQPNVKSLTFKQRTYAETPAAPTLSSDERAFWQNIFDGTHHPQPLSDPKFYPIELLGSTEDFILSGRGPAHEEAKHKLIPMRDTIRKVKTATKYLPIPTAATSQTALLSKATSCLIETSTKETVYA